MAKARVVWRCQSCGTAKPQWYGYCPECREPDSMVEEVEEVAPSRFSAADRGGRVAAPVSMLAARESETARIQTGIDEFDRVLGGGLVGGSVVLLGGEPGIGKSTLLLQAADSLARAGEKVLIACGEESPAQIGARARRLGLSAESVTLFPETNMDAVERLVGELNPTVLIVDSIQTMTTDELTGAPGSVGQVRACTNRLVHLAKGRNITTMVVGHVTKDGTLAGPRVLEHMVDTVLYFEGDRDQSFRIVRAVKNRFGASSEIGVFEMGDGGLIGVRSLSEVFLDDRAVPIAGAVLFVASEGTRPLTVEVQALVTTSYLPAPRRLANGIDTPRLLQVIAVLERHVGVSFANKDVIVAVAGGIRISEPAVDLPVALALLSALKDKPLPTEAAAFGEVSLTGKVRRATRADQRRREAEALGIPAVLSADSIGSISEAAALLR